MKSNGFVESAHRLLMGGKPGGGAGGGSGMGGGGAGDMGMTVHQLTQLSFKIGADIQNKQTGTISHEC